MVSQYLIDSGQVNETGPRPPFPVPGETYTKTYTLTIDSRLVVG